jgi:sensor histidine kinase YesM
MRWLFSIWKIRREPPPLRELPVFFLKAIIFGGLYGPVLAVLFTAIFFPQSLKSLPGPILFFWAPLEGIVWSLPFFVLCTLGNAYLRPLLNGYPSSIIGAVYVVYNFIACSLAFALIWGTLAHFPAPMRVEMPYFWRIVILDGIMGSVLALVIGAFIKLKLQVERTQTALREREVLQTQLEGEAARAQSLALQSQINPHFFFNTLNTISALIEIDPRAAQQTIGRLADLFRYTLGCAHSGPVPLEQEVQFVRDYLAIEQARFRRRLRVELPDGGMGDIRVPGLILQPLVENAVKYGISERMDGGTVSIRVHRNGPSARVSVRNTASQPIVGHNELVEENLFRPGHALENVRARLRLFTGRANPLEFRSDADWVEFSFDLELAKS